MVLLYLINTFEKRKERNLEETKTKSDYRTNISSKQRKKIEK